MNYYPNNNFYQGYSYQPQQPQTVINTLQGKVVDSIDMVRVNEIPFGGFGVFPKGDLSEVYIKSWNNNGTTQINTYKPIPNEEDKEAEAKEDLAEKIKILNEKLDLILSGTAIKQTQSQESSKPQSAPAAQKDVRVSAY